MGWEQVFDFRHGQVTFLLDSTFGTALGLPRVPWVATSPVAELLENEADSLLQSSAEVNKNAWSYTSTPSYTFMTRCLMAALLLRD
jgi:hypothetical protein